MPMMNIRKMLTTMRQRLMPMWMAMRFFAVPGKIVLGEIDG